MALTQWWRKIKTLHFCGPFVPVQSLITALRTALLQHQAAEHACPEQARLSLAELMALHGAASSHVLLLLMALLTLVPLAGAGNVLGVGMLLIAWAWWHQREAVQLPSKVGAVRLNARWSRRCLGVLLWLYQAAARFLRPRWTGLLHPWTRYGWSLWIAMMVAVIYLPLPLGNVLPSLSLVLMSLGWMFRDGLALLLSTLFGASALAYAVFLWHVAEATWRQLAAWWG
jgi:hypothetical protein